MKKRQSVVRTRLAAEMPTPVPSPTKSIPVKSLIQSLSSAWARIWMPAVKVVRFPSVSVPVRLKDRLWRMRGAS